MDHDTLELLKLSLEKYIKKSDDYISFLTHAITAEAISVLEEHTKFREDFVYKVEGLIRSSIAETTGFQPKSTPKEPSVKSHKKTSKKSLSKASLRSTIEEGDVKGCSGEKELHLKEGCPVILIVNLSDELVNGLTGKVTKVTEKNINVFFPTLKREVDVQKFSFTKYSAKLKKILEWNSFCSIANTVLFAI
ncbi:unnamed protein product [Mytilus edulis]|uniref:DNA helicase Pif1-like 2B domain-containing protein n=1 Tax=Mytilus edulis TaxID=6550 RepID=A0A8S3Q4B0_MYTED|nr:unnamed protein product [Mytilus edulis]